MTNLSLTDLVTAQRILEERLDTLRVSRDAYRGRDYVEYERRDEEYLLSPYHDQLEKIEKHRVEDYDWEDLLDFVDTRTPYYQKTMIDKKHHKD